MKFYLAGPMRGIPKWNFPAFDAEAARLRELGHVVFNPADMDRDAGFDESCGVLPEGFMREAFERDIEAIKECDAIVVLPGWLNSTGALAECGVARWLGIPIFESGSMIEVGGKLAWRFV